MANRDLHDTFLLMFQLTNMMRVKNDIMSGWENYDFMESLTRRQARALFIVATGTKQDSEGMRLKDLAASLNMTIPATSVLVETMVQKKALLRGTSSKDRRAVCIHLSEFGEKIHKALTQSMARLTADLVKGIDEKDLEIFDRLIHLFLERILEK